MSRLLRSGLGIKVYVLTLLIDQVLSQTSAWPIVYGHGLNYPMDAYCVSARSRSNLHSRAHTLRITTRINALTDVFARPTVEALSVAAMPSAALARTCRPPRLGFSPTIPAGSAWRLLQPSRPPPPAMR
jgi:hypothetical protein